MDINEQAVKDLLSKQKTGAADNGNKPGANLSALSVNDLLATGEHTKASEFQGEAVQPGQTIKPDAPGQDKPENAFKPSPGATPIGDLIGAEFVIDLFDMLLPAVFMFIVAKIGYRLEKKGMQLTAKEKNVLAKPTQAVLDKIMLDLNNPYANFALVLIIVYGSKVMEQIPDMQKLKPKERPGAELTPEKEAIGEMRKEEAIAADIANDETLEAKEKFEKELQLKLRNEQKRTKISYDKILAKWKKDGTIEKLQKKYKLPTNV